MRVHVSTNGTGVRIQRAAPLFVRREIPRNSRKVPPFVSGEACVCIARVTWLLILGRWMAMWWTSSGHLTPTDRRRERWTSEGPSCHRKVASLSWSVCKQEGGRLDWGCPGSRACVGGRGRRGVSSAAVLSGPLLFMEDPASGSWAQLRNPLGGSPNLPSNLMALQGSWRLIKDETLERSQINFLQMMFFPPQRILGISYLSYHGLKASILRRSAFFTGQLSHLYMTTEYLTPQKWCCGIASFYGSEHKVQGSSGSLRRQQSRDWKPHL